MKKAKHKYVENVIVEYKEIKRYGSTLVSIRFKSGETSDMSKERFSELFEKI